MPNIIFGDKIIPCNKGSNLRKILLAHKVALYNGAAATINCHGIGTCGTCAVKISGEVSEKAWKENTRLSLPPHHPETQKRLACQVTVEGDLIVQKFDGFWGQSDLPIA